MTRVGFAGWAVLTALAIAACEAGGQAGSAAAACATAAGNYKGTTVVGAFGTNIAAVRALQPLPQAPLLWPDLPADHPAILCYIDGDIPKGPPPGADGSIPPSFDRGVVAVVDGEAVLVMAGYRDRLPVRAP